MPEVFYAALGGAIGGFFLGVMAFAIVASWLEWEYTRSIEQQERKK